VATCVYGSYDCPQVWVLRRFRDNWLAKRTLGRAFIRLYYTFSPWVVAHFGQTKAFQSFFRHHLDKFVNRLEADGYENTAYNDPSYERL
jgi:hypothetical protein